MKVSRKEVLLGGIGLAVLGLVACGDDSPSPSPSPTPNPTPDAGTGDAGSGSVSCLDNGTNANIASNHGHVLEVSKEDVAAGVDKAYDITGSASHPHEVTVTAAMFASLAANTPVTMESSVDNEHSHMVTVVCV